MLTPDTDMADEVARALHKAAQASVMHEGKQRLVKDLGYELSNKIAELVDEYPGAVSALALSSIVGATSVRLTEMAQAACDNSGEALAKQGIDTRNMVVPDPHIHALAIYLLARQYINVCTAVHDAADEAAEHVENGGKLS
jgi:hypothetical protein